MLTGPGAGPARRSPRSWTLTSWKRCPRSSAPTSRTPAGRQAASCSACPISTSRAASRPAPGTSGPAWRSTPASPRPTTSGGLPLLPCCCREARSSALPRCCSYAHPARTSRATAASSQQPAAPAPRQRPPAGACVAHPFAPTPPLLTPSTLHPPFRAHFWGEPDKKVDGFLQDLTRSIPAVQKDPNNTIIGDASESTFAFYWAAGGRAHRGFQEVRACRSCRQGSCCRASHGQRGRQLLGRASDLGWTVWWAQRRSISTRLGLGTSSCTLHTPSGTGSPHPRHRFPPPPAACLQKIVPCWSACNKADPSPNAMYACMNKECYPSARAADQAVRAWHWALGWGLGAGHPRCIGAGAAAQWGRGVQLCPPP
jgi:hypothetical protein